MSRITITDLECTRCGHKWLPRKKEVKVCPHCKSPYWACDRVNKDRINKVQ